MTKLKIPLLYSDLIESIPPNEHDDLRCVIEAVEKVIARNQATSGKNQGEVHVKTHGYALGELRVLPNLPNELAQGLFEETRTYRVIVRFSNSAGQVQSDVIPDGRGMAIKVREPAGELLSGPESQDRSQDFLMINHPVFFAATVKDYLRLQEILAENNANALVKFGKLLTGGDVNPLHWHWNQLLTAARIVGKLPAHPANTTYFSMTPIRFGQHVAKYRVQPAGERSDSLAELIKTMGTEVDPLRLAIESILDRQELLFELQVQLWVNAQTMPIEDATVEWSESISPYRTVAHLLLPRQDIRSLRNQQEFKELTFNVWHSLTDHRPLGGINRSRRAVYAVSAARRL